MTVARRPARDQLRRLAPVFTVVGGTIGALYVVVYIVAQASDRPFVFFIEDPAYIWDAPFYTGAFNYVSVLGWWTAAVLAGTAAGLLFVARERRFTRPLLVLSLISSALMIDDLFQIHEDVLEDAGVPQYVTYLVYLAVFCVTAWRGLEFVRESDWLPLLVALLLLGSAGIVDQIGDELGQHHDTSEEGLELLGTAAWLVYVGSCSLRHLTVRVSSPDSAPTRSADPAA